MKINKTEIQNFALWDKKRQQPRSLYSFNIELTARCNNNCRHCYINLPVDHAAAQAQELSADEITNIADQALEMGAFWVMLTGGEPLLRPDFPEIYMLLKRKGLLVSVFTNATLVTPQHVALFQKYPPRDIEVTLYGASQHTYERVTRLPGSYQAFTQGLDALFAAGVRVRLKAMAMRSTLADIDAIAAFGRKYTKDYYRFDPVLHLRLDRNEGRNLGIRQERLTPEEVVALEQADRVRREALQKDRESLFIEAFKNRQDHFLFHCGLGTGNFTVGYDGTFRLCSSLCAPGTTVNLRQVTLWEAWEDFVPTVRAMQTDNTEYLDACGKCPIANLCLNCPAHAYLETGLLDSVSPYFCQVAHARAEALGDSPSEA